jgi:hypothetical protein
MTYEEHMQLSNEPKSVAGINVSFGLPWDMGGLIKCRSLCQVLCLFHRYPTYTHLLVCICSVIINTCLKKEFRYLDLHL